MLETRKWWPTTVPTDELKDINEIKAAAQQLLDTYFSLGEPYNDKMIMVLLYEKSENGNYHVRIAAKGMRDLENGSQFEFANGTVEKILVKLKD